VVQFGDDLADLSPTFFCLSVESVSKSDVQNLGRAMLLSLNRRTPLQDLILNAFLRLD